MSDAAANHHLPCVLRDLTLSYLSDYELLPWINENDLDWGRLSRNPAAIQLLEMNPYKLDWTELSRNPAAIHLLELHTNEINWWNLSRNPSAIHLLEKNLDKVHWDYIAQNPNAEHIIKHNLNKTPLNDLMMNPTCFRYCVDDQSEWFDRDSALHEDIWSLYKNRGDEAFNLLYEIDNHRIIGEMYANPLAIRYIDHQLHDDIDWKYLSMNPAAIDILEAHPDQINWDKLSKNPAAMRLLETNQHKIEWSYLSANPGIFERVPKSEIDTLL
jgi:hypothetical protein